MTNNALRITDVHYDVDAHAFEAQIEEALPGGPVFYRVQVPGSPFWDYDRVLRALAEAALDHHSTKAAA